MILLDATVFGTIIGVGFFAFVTIVIGGNEIYNYIVKN